MSGHESLRVELGERGYEQAAVAATLEKLGELGYLDDAACARSLAAGSLSRRGYGPLRVRAELERRGAAAGEAEAAGAELFVEGGGAAARKAAERWLSRRAPRPGARAALARHLDRKGFTTGTVLRLARELARDDED